MSELFRTDAVPVAARADYWDQVIDGTPFPLEGRPSDGPGFNATLRTGELGVVKVIEASTPAGECRRTRRMIRRSNPDLHQIGVIVRGTVVVEQDGRQARLGPGDIGFVDHSRPARFVHPDVSHVDVAFPRALLPLPRRAPLRVPGSTGTAALVSALARHLPGQLDHLHPHEGVRIGQTLVDLLAVAFAARLGQPSWVTPDARRRALLERVYVFIEQHLADPGLSPQAIAAAHHISVRYLHKLFESQQWTVAGWIRRRRLEQCRQDLLDPALRDRPVSAIAARWGLTNAAHFSRAFRDTFDLPPAEYQRLGGSGAPTSSGVTWLDRSLSTAARLSSS